MIYFFRERLSMPKVTLVIAIYNLEKYIRECLDSILLQTFKDMEIICVDDGSTDSTPKILEEYAQKDSRIKIIHQKNQGCGAARNTGLSEACGEYIQFLDGDDYFEPKMVEKLYNLAKKHSADISACSSRKVDDYGNITESRNPNSPINLLKTPLNKPFSRHDLPDDIFSLIGYVPWNKMYLTSMIKKNGIEYLRLVGGEDMGFVLMALACAQKVVVTDDELINYRFNRPGSVYTYRANHASDILKTSILVKDFLIKKGLYEELKTAHKRAFISAMRWEISLCSDAQYEKFLSEIKNILPDGWMEYKAAFRKDYVTYDFLNNFIGDKKVFLWGASNFIKTILSSNNSHNPNILGIIDGNISMQGQYVASYKVFPKDILSRIKPDGIILTVINNHETIYPELKSALKKEYPDITLLPNIFDMD